MEDILEHMINERINIPDNYFLIFQSLDLNVIFEDKFCAQQIVVRDILLVDVHCSIFWVHLIIF